MCQISARNKRECEISRTWDSEATQREETRGLELHFLVNCCLHFFLFLWLESDMENKKKMLTTKRDRPLWLEARVNKFRMQIDQTVLFCFVLFCFFFNLKHRCLLSPYISLWRRLQQSFAASFPNFLFCLFVFFLFFFKYLLFPAKLFLVWHKIKVDCSKVKWLT